MFKHETIQKQQSCPKSYVLFPGIWNGGGGIDKCLGEGGANMRKVIPEKYAS